MGTFRDSEQRVCRVANVPTHHYKPLAVGSHQRRHHRVIIPHLSSNSTCILVSNMHTCQFSRLHLQRLQRYLANEILLTQRNKQTYCQNSRNHLHGGPHYKSYLPNHLSVVDTQTQRDRLKTASSTENLPMLFID